MNKHAKHAALAALNDHYMTHQEPPMLGELKDQVADAIMSVIFECNTDESNQEVIDVVTDTIMKFHGTSDAVVTVDPVTEENTFSVIAGVKFNNDPAWWTFPINLKLTAWAE